MAFVHEQSCECTKSELGLFSVPPTQTSMEQGSWVEYHPMTTVTDGWLIEFDISGTGEDYIDFANTMLYVKTKVTLNNPAADAAVGPVSLFLHNLFSQVDISLNGTLITAWTNTYPYRALLETLLSYGEDAKKTQLTSALFYKDQAGRMDSVDFAADAVNEGLAKRRTLVAESRTFDMTGRLHADMFFQDRYLASQRGGRKDKTSSQQRPFCLMGACKVRILHASMFVRKVKLTTSIFLAHVKTLERGTAKYPIRRVVCKSFTLCLRFVRGTMKSPRLVVRKAAGHLCMTNEAHLEFDPLLDRQPVQVSQGGRHMVHDNSSPL